VPLRVAGFFFFFFFFFFVFNGKHFDHEIYFNNRYEYVANILAKARGEASYVYYVFLRLF
jgi:hypothetical protein